MLSVRGNDLLEYLTGEQLEPTEKGIAKKNWLANDALIMSFLLGFMETSISQNFVLLNSVKEIWYAAKQTYGQSNNYALIMYMVSNLYK